MNGILRSTIAFCLSMSATCAFAQEVTIRYSSWLPVNHWLNQKQFLPWFAEIEKATEGRVKVEMLPKTVGTALSQFDVVRDGLADMSFIIPSYTPGRFPLIEMGELPLLGDDASTMARVFEQSYRKHFLPLDEFAGVKMLAVYNITPVQPFNAKHPIRTVADFKGLKLRSPNTFITATMNRLGAVAILKSSMEAYELLSTGAIDGQITQADTVVVNNMAPLMKYGTIIPGGMSNSAHIVAINPDKWAEISKADQKAIEAVTTEKLGPSIGKGFQDNEMVAMEAMVNAGYKIDHVDANFVKEFQAVVKPIEEEWIERAKAKGVADPAAILADFRSGIAAAHNSAQ
jgi:TRAP-type C4-dicarboxylate transport system substrate-binding protein